MRWLWLPFNALQALYVAAWSAFWISAALLVRLATGSPEPSLAMARTIWAPGILWAGGARVEVEGLDKLDLSRPLFFAVNHQSMIDIPALFKALPVNLRFVVKEELTRVPFLGWYITAMGMIAVDRRARFLALDRVRTASGKIGPAGGIVFFPEGTRSRGGELLPFKTGVFIPPIETGIAIVPVAIEGARAVLPADGFRVRPGIIRLTFGQPVETAGLTRQDRRQLADRVHGEVARLLAEGAPDRL